MKKFVFSTLFIGALSAAVLVISCKEKANNAITPTYKNLAQGTGANPCIQCISVTGTSTVTNPATQNTAINVGGTNPGWSFDGCATSLNTLTGHNGNTTIQMTFGGGAITTGNYALVSTLPLSGQARMIVTNAPGQPDGIVWYSKSGTVAVTTGTAGTQATFNNVQCLQQNFLFPVVTVSGNLTCI